MRRDFRYTGIHNIQNNLKFRRNFRWKAGLPLKKIRIQRVSVFDIAVTLHDSDLAMLDAEQMRKAQQLVCNSQYQNMRNDVTNKVTEGIESLTELIRSNQGRAATIFTDCENPGESIFKDADQALYQVKQNGRHGCGFH